MPSAVAVNALVFDAMPKSVLASTGAGSPSFFTPYPRATTTALSLTTASETPGTSNVFIARWTQASRSGGALCLAGTKSSRKTTTRTRGMAAIVAEPWPASCNVTNRDVDVRQAACEAHPMGGRYQRRRPRRVVDRREPGVARSHPAPETRRDIEGQARRRRRAAGIRGEDLPAVPHPRRRSQAPPEEPAESGAFHRGPALRGVGRPVRDAQEATPFQVGRA